MSERNYLNDENGVEAYYWINIHRIRNFETPIRVTGSENAYVSSIE